MFEHPVDRKINPILGLAALVEEHLAIRAPFVHALKQQAIRLLHILWLSRRPRQVQGRPRLPESVEIGDQTGAQQEEQRDNKADDARMVARIGENFVVVDPIIPITRQHERHGKHHKNRSRHEAGFSVRWKCSGAHVVLPPALRQGKVL